MAPVTAYNVGFGAYWLLCYLVPIAVLGPRRTWSMLHSGGPLKAAEVLALSVPVIGGAASELVPARHRIRPDTAAVMTVCAVVNAVGEELFWRGMFAAVFPRERVRGMLWPLTGFSLWHLAPQVILPSRHGRWRFTAGAFLVGLGPAVVVFRTGVLRAVLPAHIAVDACGVGAAEFRLNRQPVVARR